MTVALTAGRIALVAPRNMRFSPSKATSIDLHIHEIACWSRYRDRITIHAEDIDDPYRDVTTRFWPKNARTKQIVETVRSGKPDLVVVHQHLPTAHAIARTAPEVPVILIRHNFQKPPRNALSRLLKQRQFNRFAAIGFVSECCRADFRAAWPQVRTPVHVVLNGIDTGRWKSAPAKEPLILFVGRMAPEKGALEAASALVSVLDGNRPDWRGVFITASAPEHPDYARAVTAEIGKAGGRIALLSDQRHETVRRYMAQAAIVIAPTRNSEPFGRVAIEAMASEAVLIASAKGGFVEIAGETAILLDTPDAPAIAAPLKRLMNDEQERSQRGSEGRAKVIERYDLPKAAATFDELVTPLLPVTTA